VKPAARHHRTVSFRAVGLRRVHQELPASPWPWPRRDALVGNPDAPICGRAGQRLNPPPTETHVVNRFESVVADVEHGRTPCR
jgi:hypothetical protein